MNWTACADFPTGVARHPRAARNGIVCCCVLRAACCVRPSYGTRPTMHCQWGWLGSFSFFLSLMTLTLTFEFGRDFCTTYLIAKFDRPTFSRSEVIVRTNWQTHTGKQTDAAENIHLASLRYAGG